MTLVVTLVTQGQSLRISTNFFYAFSAFAVKKDAAKHIAISCSSDYRIKILVTEYVI